MTVRSMLIYAVAATAICLNSAASAESWSEAVCKAAAKSPICALFKTSGPVPEDERMKQIKAFYFAKLDKWTLSPEPTTMQDQVVTTCGMLTIFSAPPETAKKYLNGDERDEFDARVDACSKLTAHRAWPQPDFAKPQTVDLVCIRWTALLRELCIKAKLDT
jgi:hypothetical protein